MFAQILLALGPVLGLAPHVVVMIEGLRFLESPRRVDLSPLGRPRRPRRRCLRGTSPCWLSQFACSSCSTWAPLTPAAGGNVGRQCRHTAGRAPELEGAAGVGHGRGSLRSLCTTSPAGVGELLDIEPPSHEIRIPRHVQAV